MTKDLVETIEKKCNRGINRTLALQIQALEDEFLNQFWQYTPKDSTPIALNAKNLAAALHKIYRLETLPCISLDPIYAPNTLFNYAPCPISDLSVTRITNPQTGEKRLGPRPCKKPIDDQIKEISEICSKIGLIDCGAFDGDTLLDIIERFERQAVTVQRIYLAISSFAAREKISRKCNVIVNNLFNFKEWIELRDLFGIDGRKVSETENAFIPYWENLTSWASISQANERAVIALCKCYNKLLSDMLIKDKYDMRSIGIQVPYGQRSQQ